MNPANSHSIDQAGDQAGAVTPSQSAPPSPPRFPFVIVVCVWLLVVITTALVTFILPESFSSTARIKIERDRPDISGLAERGTTIGYDPYFIQTEFELIRSELILGKVIEDLDLNKKWGRKYAGGERLKTTESMALLKMRLDLRPVRNTSIIESRVFSEEPDEAAKIANALAEAYKTYRQQQRMQLRRGGINALEKAYEENNQKARTIRAEMAELSRQPSSQNSNRLDEAQRRLDELQRFGQILFLKIASEKTDLSLPASTMVEIVDRAFPSLKPVRPNKALNITIGIIVGGLGGLFLATLVYVLQRREFRRRSGVPRTPLPPRFRAVVHILIALVVGVVVGYHLATPFDLTTIIVVPLTLLLGAIGSAYIELCNVGTDDGNDGNDGDGDDDGDDGS